MINAVTPRIPPTPRTLRQPRLGFLTIAALSVAVGIVAPAQALVSKAPSNNVAPADDPGWARVGSLGNGTGVYLGNGWAMTAAHVDRSTPLTIDGTPYVATGQTSLLKNPDTTDSDILLFQITVPDGSPLASLPTITFPTVAPAPTDNLVIIGTGLLPSGGEQTFSGSETGFVISSLRDKTWGDNNRLNVGFDGSRSEFNTAFDNSLALPNEAEAVDHDSGSPVFVNNMISGVPTWQLAGLVYGVVRSNFNSTDAFSAGAHADYGDETFAMNLSNPTYRNQIASVIPEPASAALLGLVLAGGLACRPAGRKR